MVESVWRTIISNLLVVLQGMYGMKSELMTTSLSLRCWVTGNCQRTSPPARWSAVIYRCHFVSRRLILWQVTQYDILRAFLLHHARIEYLLRVVGLRKYCTSYVRSSEVRYLRNPNTHWKLTASPLGSFKCALIIELLRMHAFVLLNPSRYEIPRQKSC
jgi:hypothetical protein